MVSNPLDANHEHEKPKPIAKPSHQPSATVKGPYIHVHVYNSLESPPQNVRYVLYNGDSVYTYIRTYVCCTFEQFL